MDDPTDAPPPAGETIPEPTPPPPPDTPPGPRWHPAARVVLYLVAFVIAQVIAMIPVALAIHFLGPHTAAARRVGLILGFLPLAPLLLLVTWGFLRVLDRRRLADVGVRWPANGVVRSSLRGLLLGAGLAGFWALLVAVPRYLVFHGQSAAFAADPAKGVAILVGIAVLFVIQGATEELAFRGYVFHTLLDRVSPSTAALLSSLLFAAAHLANPHYGPAAFVNTFLIGMVLVSLVRRSRSLLSASLLHGAWNFTIACLLSVPVSGFELFHLLRVTLPGPAGATGGGYGPEASWMLTVPLALVAFWAIPRGGRPAEAGTDEAKVAGDAPPPEAP